MKNILTYDELLQAHGQSFTGDDVVAELSKSLATTAGTNSSSLNPPLMLENLDATMTEVLIGMKHFKIFNSIAKVPSIQPNYEYNKQTSRGSRRGSLGFAQGGGPTGNASNFVRKNAYVKFLGVKGAVTHQFGVTAQMGGAFVDPETQENKDRTIELLERVERDIIFGLSTILDEDGNDVNFDGLLAQLTSQYAANVIDMEGAPLTYDELDDTALSLVKLGKLPSVDGFKVMMSPDVAAGLNKQYAERNVVRHNKDTAQNATYAVGFKVPKYETQFGDLEFDNSILLEECDGNNPVAAAHAEAPAAPATVAGTPADDADSLLPANTYYYFVSAFNESGESLPTASSGVVASDDTTKVTLAIANSSGAIGYRIYRGTTATAADARWIAKVPQGVGSIAYVDKNQWRTVDSNGDNANGLAIVYNGDPTNLCVAQLAPLAKMRLPQEKTTFPFYLLLYLTMVLKAPERVRIYKNCGKYTPA